MGCRQIEPLLLDHLSGSLTEQKERQLQAHLAKCPACRRRREEWRAVRSLGAGLDELTPPPHLREHIMAGWRAAHCRRGPAAQHSLFRRGAALLAAVCVALILLA